MCSSKGLFIANHYSLVWRSSASFDLSSAWHKLHLYFKFKWISRCFRKPAIRLNVIGQSGHLSVFSVWQIRWVCKLDDVLNLFPHSKHKNAENLSLSSMNQTKMCVNFLLTLCIWMNLFMVSQWYFRSKSFVTYSTFKLLVIFCFDIIMLNHDMVLFE